MTSLENYQKWLNSGILTEEEYFNLKSIESDEQEIHFRFGSELEFGTAGLRGIMDLGTNRMNTFIVGKTTQGLADYLWENEENPTVVISYDSRNNSRQYAEVTACVLSANGIRNYIFHEMMPVPVLSYAVRHLHCTAGIMITASHNPKDYNGYKVYNATGGQILDGEAKLILDKINQVDLFTDVKQISFDEALSTYCSHVDESVYDAYLSTMDKVSNYTRERNLQIVYTPLNGSGRRPVQDILAKNGFSYITVAEQEFEDGEFTTCPSPNPENEAVYEVALRYAHENNADLIVATDPDCDRVGTMVKHEEHYALLSGNEIGALMLQYICECSPNLEDKFVCTSMVSTLLADTIAQSYDLEVKRTHVGFKYIGEQIEKNPDNYLFGFEESNGYLVGNYARDKDGVVAAKLLCQMAAHYKVKKLSLIDVLEKLYEKYGYVVDKTMTITIDSQEESEKIMEILRNKGEVFHAFRGIAEYVDYNDETFNTGLPMANVIKIVFRNGSRLIIRPSGTEPKVKIYVSSYGESKTSCVIRIEEILVKLNQLIGME